MGITGFASGKPSFKNSGKGKSEEVKRDPGV